MSRDLPDNSYNIPIDLLARLGLIVTRCAWIDELLGTALAHLIGADQAPMYVITQNVAASTVADWLRTLGPLHLKDTETLDTLRDLLSLTDDLRRERNALVHGLWSDGPFPGTAMIRSIRLDRAELIVERLCTIADLEDVIERCAETLGKAVLLLAKLKQ